MEDFKPNSVNSDYIQYGVNLLRLRGLQNLMNLHKVWQNLLKMCQKQCNIWVTLYNFFVKHKYIINLYEVNL